MRKEIPLILNLKGAQKGITKPIGAPEPEKITIANDASSMQLNDQNSLTINGHKVEVIYLALEKKPNLACIVHSVHINRRIHALFRGPMARIPEPPASSGVHT